MAGFKSELTKGQINTLILLNVLTDADRYNLEIREEIFTRSGGQYNLNEQTLYSSLKRLENQGLISSYLGGANQLGARRKYFTLTDGGRDFLEKNKEQWQKIQPLVYSLITNEPFKLVLAQKQEQTIEEDSSVNPCQQSVNAKQIEQAESEKETEAGKTEVFFQEELSPPLSVIATQVKDDEPKENDEGQSAQIHPQSIKASTPQFNDSSVASPSYYQSLDKARVEIDNRRSTSFYDKLLYTNNYENEQAPIVPSSPIVAPIPPENQSEIPYISDESELNERLVRQIISEYKKPVAEVEAPVYKREPIDKQRLRQEYLEKEYKNILGRIFNKVEQPVVDNAYIAPSPQEVVQQTQGVSVVKNMYRRSAASESAATVLSKEIAPISSKELAPRMIKKNEKSDYYLCNKLRLVHFGIMFALILTEVFVAFITLKLVYNITQKNENFYYLMSVLVAFALPIIAAAFYSLNPYKKKYIFYKFSDSLVTYAAIAINLIIIIFILNFFAFSRNIYELSTYAVSLILPSILALNLPISCIVFNILLKSGKFSG